MSLLHWPQNWEPKEHHTIVAATAGNKAFIHWISKGKDRQTGKEVHVCPSNCPPARPPARPPACPARPRQFLPVSARTLAHPPTHPTK